MQQIGHLCEELAARDEKTLLVALDGKANIITTAEETGLCSFNIAHMSTSILKASPVHLCMCLSVLMLTNEICGGSANESVP